MKRATEAPYYLHLADQAVFAFASLWDRSIKADGTVVESCTIITMPANTLIHDIYNSGNNPRGGPAILSRAAPSGSMAARFCPQTPVRPHTLPADLMVAWRVSARVNSPKNNGPELITPTP